MATRRTLDKNGRLNKILSKDARTHACNLCGAHCDTPTTLSIHERFCDGKKLEVPHVEKPRKRSPGQRWQNPNILHNIRGASCEKEV